MLEECNKNQLSGNGEPEVEKFIVYYDNGDQKTIEKGFFCEMSKDNECELLTFIMANVSGKEIASIVFGCMELGIKLGLFDKKDNDKGSFYEK